MTVGLSIPHTVACNQLGFLKINFK
jgi:hypothetical protein